jgi:hypothetical protein
MLHLPCRLVAPALAEPHRVARRGRFRQARTLHACDTVAGAVQRVTTAILLLTAMAGPAMAQEPSWAQAQSIPRWAAPAFESPAFGKDYALSVRLNPFLLQGDFDGDGRLDVAVLVERRRSGADGIAILHAASKQPIVLGAGRSFGNGGDDWSWMDAWSVVPRSSPEREGEGATDPHAKGDALRVEKLESAGALVYWDGARLRWRQQGD